jgi:hypothetical protein
MSRERLAKLLGMLGSSYDGEIANAARMIAAMAKKEGKGIADYVMSGGVQVVYRDRIVEKTVYRDRPQPDAHYGRTRGNPGDDSNRRQRGETFDDDDLRNYRTGPKREPPKDDTDLLAGLRWARDFPHHLSGFEVEFIDDVLKVSRFGDMELTWRQAKVARRIIKKVKSYEGEPLV